MRINRPVIGFLLGIILPVIGFFVVFLAMRGNYSLGAFLEILSAQHRLLSTVISLSILANLIPFIYFNSRRLDEASKGVFIATMLFAVVIVLLRFVWS
jgi:heme/copper-type cytochrome/quinol oxidase subunit 4